MKGTYRYPDGSEYSGDWQEGQRHGYGMMKFPDGSKYYGIFDNGLCQGTGTMTFSDKSQYVLYSLKEQGWILEFLKGGLVFYH
jgi:hypothetical protein